jgi:hypothetical protein
MWLMKVSELSEVCLMCFAMTDLLQADRNLWIGTTNSSVAHFQDDKPPAAKSKVYTNDDLSRPGKKKGTKSNQNKSGEPASTQSSKQKSAPRDSHPPSTLDNYRDAQGHDRSYWQKRIRPLRGKLDGLDLQIQSLQERQANTNVTTGLKVSRKGQLQTSQKDSAATLAKKMDDLKQKRVLVVKSIQEVEEDARKAQALPEWLR